jgi:hypothetical protein
VIELVLDDELPAREAKEELLANAKRATGTGQAVGAASE